MSFGTDLRHIMTNDSSLNTSFDGGILFENLPDNFKLTKKWLLYYFRKSEQVDCIGVKNAYGIIELSTVLIAQTTDELLTLTDSVIDYLNGNSYGTIQEITFKNDGHSFDKEKNIYTNTLQFDIIYF